MTASALLRAFGLFVAAYFVLYAVLQLAMAPAASRLLWRHRRRSSPRAMALADDPLLRPQVSIVVPTRNQELTVVDSVRALLAVEYDPLEIVVVNDGSTDSTLDALSRAFDLVAAPLAFAQPLTSAPVHAGYRSIAAPRLMVIDKESGGCKADAINAGINAASGTLVLVIDADTVLDPESVSRTVVPFLDDPATIAVGGHVAITNGCRIEDGRIVTVALPRSWLARWQILEHMRSFLLFRLACALHNGVVLISGAYGMFRRSALLAVGGYDRTAIGEDMDLTLRLQAHYRQRGEPFRIAFDPNPLGWTQVPEDWSSFKAQRCRWRRGLLQVLWRQRRLLANPRYGVLGMVVLPFILVFEGLGPMIEIVGYGVAIGAGLAGIVQWQYFAAVMGVALLFGLSVNLAAVLLSDIATRRYMEGRDLLSLVAVAIAESAGYRQCTAWLSCVGTVQALTGKRGWGAMARRAFGWAIFIAMASGVR